MCILNVKLIEKMGNIFLILRGNLLLDAIIYKLSIRYHCILFHIRAIINQVSCFQFQTISKLWWKLMEADQKANPFAFAQLSPSLFHFLLFWERKKGSLLHVRQCMLCFWYCEPRGEVGWVMVKKGCWFKNTFFCILWDLFLKYLGSTSCKY